MRGIPARDFIRSIVLSISLVLALVQAEAKAQETPDYELAEVMVKLQQPGDLAGVIADHGLAAAPLGQFGSRPIYRLQILDGTPPPDKAEALAGDSRVLYAEPNYLNQTPEGQQRISWARGGDGDEYADQWAGDYLGLPAAHSVTRGAGIVVAILDTGVDPTHPELAGRLLPGHDFVDMDDDPSEVGVAGEDISYGHGTHVAGLVALAAPDAHILPLRVLDRDGVGNIWVLAESLAYAVNPDGDIATPDGAHVINLSLSTRRSTELLEEIIEAVICEDDDGDDGDDGQVFAADDDDDCLATPGRGAVVVAAAGNQASTTPEYPAAELIPGLLSVTANAEDDTLATFANFGTWVHVAAPGDRILSTVPGGEFGVWSGTSMAAPLVAGQAALVRASEATLTAAQVADRIRTSAAPGPADEPPRVDAAASLALPPTQRPVTPEEPPAPPVEPPESPGEPAETAVHVVFLPVILQSATVR